MKNDRNEHTERARVARRSPDGEKTFVYLPEDALLFWKYKV